MGLSPKLPLDGLRVLDLADEKGELCGRLLGDLGADVVRVEPPEGAVSRRLPPFAPDGASLYFAYRNSNKRGVVIDLDTPAGAEHLAELAAAADVLIDTERPGRFADLGLDDLLDRHPHLVWCSITDFGQTGPYADFAATDDVVVALSGNLATSGIPEKPPLLIPGAFAYDAVGIHAAFAVLCALHQRGADGAGQRLDVSALAAAMQLNTWGIPNTSITVNEGMDPPVSRAGTSPIYPTIPTADGFLRIVLLAERQWRAMFEWMGEPEAFAAEEWNQIFFRLMNADVLNLAFTEFFADKKMVEAAEEAQRRGVVATPMLTPPDVLASDHYRSRATFTDAEVAPGVTAKTMAGFGELDGKRAGFRFPAPAPGEHEADIGWDPRPAPTRVDGRAAPLAGLRVMDFGHGGVGVEAGRLLAEYGADVIKIETRTYPDFIRIVLGGEMTASFASSSRSKRSFGINAKTPEGRELLLRLAESTDVVIENNSTGTMAAMGLGYDDLAAANPAVVMTSSQLMGSRGTFAAWVGYGPTLQTVGGLNALWNFPDGDPPPGSNAIHPDHVAGRVLATFGLASLLGRAQRGGGTHVEVAQVEALVATLGDLFQQESLAPGTVRPMGNTSERGAPWGVFRCAGDDDWCVITVRHDADWAALVAVMGAPDWSHDPGLATADGRRAARVDVDAGVERWTRGLDRHEVMHRCQAAGVPAGVMLTTLDQLTDPHFVATGLLAEIDQPGAGPMTLEGPAFTGSNMTPARIEPAPLLCEHTVEIAHDLLGLSADDIDRLVASGALELPTEEQP